MCFALKPSEVRAFFASPPRVCQVFRFKLPRSMKLAYYYTETISRYNQKIMIYATRFTHVSLGNTILINSVGQRHSRSFNK